MLNTKTKREWIVLLCRFFFLTYVFVMIYFLFFSERYGRTSHYDTMQYNLVPFQEIQRYLVNAQSFSLELFVVNILGNVCMFIPFGALLFVWRGKPVGFWYVTVRSLLLSLLIESIQLVTKVGVFDVDDIILNTAGGIVGFLIYQLARKIVRRIR